MAISSQPVNSDAAQILDRIRAEVRFESAWPRVAARLYAGDRGACEVVVAAHRLSWVADEVPEEIRRLYGLLERDMVIAMSRFGEMPPTPRTLRGLLGRAVVRVLRGLLWWYTRSLRIFGESVAAQFHRQAEVLESMALRQAEYRTELAALQEEVRRLRESLPKSPSEDSETL